MKTHRVEFRQPHSSSLLIIPTSRSWIPCTATLRHGFLQIRNTHRNDCFEFCWKEINEKLNVSFWDGAWSDDSLQLFVITTCVKWHNCRHPSVLGHCLDGWLEWNLQPSILIYFAQTDNTKTNTHMNRTARHSLCPYNGPQEYGQNEYDIKYNKRQKTKIWQHTTVKHENISLKTQTDKCIKSV